MDDPDERGGEIAPADDDTGTYELCDERRRDNAGVLLEGWPDTEDGPT